MAVTGTVRIGASASHTGSVDLGSNKAEVALTHIQDFAAGSGNGQINKAWSDERAISGAANDDIDLAGSLTDAQGAAVVFTAVKAIVIEANAANAGNLTIGAAGTNPHIGPFADASDKIVLKPGACFAITAPNTGWTVGAGASDVLRVASAGDATYKIMVLGV